MWRQPRQQQNQHHQAHQAKQQQQAHSYQVVQQLVNMNAEERNNAIANMMARVDPDQRDTFYIKLMERLFDHFTQAWRAWMLEGNIDPLELVRHPDLAIQGILQLPGELREPVIDWFVDSFGQGDPALRLRMKKLLRDAISPWNTFA